MKLGGSLKPSTGILSKEDRKTSQGYVDLKKKTVQEIEELIERQEKLLKNRSFIMKLPDKGEKITSFKKELENELKRRQNEYNLTCKLLSDLTLSSTKSEDMEWTNGKLNQPKTEIDSDDDSDGEVDPLKLMATHSGTVQGVKVKTESSVGGGGDDNSGKEVSYADKLCEKFGNALKPKERFKPNQLKDNNNLFAKSAENLKKKLGDKWEVTQAIPPVPIYKDTVLISLSESLKLQKEQAEKLKEIERKQAAAKLIRKMGIKMGEKLPVNNITEYRTVKNTFDESVPEEEECYDSEGEEKDRTVCYTIDLDNIEGPGS